MLGLGPAAAEELILEAQGWHFSLFREFFVIRYPVVRDPIVIRYLAPRLDCLRFSSLFITSIPPGLELSYPFL